MGAGSEKFSGVSVNPSAFLALILKEISYWGGQYPIIVGSSDRKYDILFANSEIGSQGLENLIGLVDRHIYLGATPGELSFSMGVLPGASGSCHVAYIGPVSLVVKR